MKRILGAVACLTVVGLANPADAHSPFPGAGEFYNGMLHPLIVPAYLLGILGLGLLFGQKAPQSSQFAVPAFGVSVVAAMAMPHSVAGPLPQSILLGVVLVAGLVVALSLNLGAILPCLFAVFAGALIGLDIRQNALAEGQSWIALAGAATGAIIAVAMVAAFVVWLRRAWNGIAVRVLGSWTAASAFLVIALSFAPITVR